MEAAAQLKKLIVSSRDGLIFFAAFALKVFFNRSISMRGITAVRLVLFLLVCAVFACSMQKIINAFGKERRQTALVAAAILLFSYYCFFDGLIFSTLRWSQALSLLLILAAAVLSTAGGSRLFALPLAAASALINGEIAATFIPSVVFAVLSLPAPEAKKKASGKKKKTTLMQRLTELSLKTPKLLCCVLLAALYVAALKISAKRNFITFAFPGMMPHYIKSTYREYLVIAPFLAAFAVLWVLLCRKSKRFAKPAILCAAAVLLTLCSALLLNSLSQLCPLFVFAAAMSQPLVLAASCSAGCSEIIELSESVGRRYGFAAGLLLIFALSVGNLYLG